MSNQDNANLLYQPLAWHVPEQYPPRCTCPKWIVVIPATKLQGQNEVHACLSNSLEIQFDPEPIFEGDGAPMNRNSGISHWDGYWHYTRNNVLASHKWDKARFASLTSL